MANQNTNKIKFLLDSVLDVTPSSSGLVSVSASSAASGLPASNVQNPLIRRVYRSTDTNTEFLRWDLGSPQTIRQVFIGNHNFSKSASVTFSGNTTSNFTAPATNLTINVATDGLGATLTKTNTFFATAQTYRHWRLKVVDPSNASSSLQIGRVMAGSAVNPRRNLSDGFTRRIIDPSRGAMTAGRQGYFKIRQKYEELVYNLSFLDRTDWIELQAIYNKVGMHAPFVVSLQPETEPTEDSFYMQFSQQLDFNQVILDTVNAQRITLSEKN
jgi:hypothetical protein